MFESLDLIPRLDCGGRALLMDRPRIMGVLNLTPDSFSDGGRLGDLDGALRAALRMVEEGADIIDVGGESTRPGAAPVGVQEEIDRVLPLIERLAAESSVPISIDTSKPEVMRAAVGAGAGLINDVWALRRDGALAMAAELGVPVCLMHMQGEPGSMQADPQYTDVMAEVQRFLADRVFACELAGIPRARLLVDPGFGFGKTLQHNVELMSALSALGSGLPPLLAGRRSCVSTMSPPRAMVSRCSPRCLRELRRSGCSRRRRAGAMRIEHGTPSRVPNGRPRHTRVCLCAFHRGQGASGSPRRFCMKLRWLVVSVAVFGMGAVQAQDTSSEKGKLSYAIGYQLGREMAERGVDLDVATVVNGVQEGFAKRDPSVPPEEMRAAVEKMQSQMLEQARAEFERVAAENKAKSEQFLSQNRGKQGIQNLASGIQYRVIEQGNGPQPTAASEVQIHFRGSLSTGQEFASTYTGNEPVTMKVSEAPLPGLREVLPMMKAGSRWEVFLPPDQGYGDNPRSPVGPGQAVVFDVKLVSIK